MIDATRFKAPGTVACPRRNGRFDLTSARPRARADAKGHIACGSQGAVVPLQHHTRDLHLDKRPSRVLHLLSTGSHIRC
ncbi:hypothetical protein [Elioraea sp.]|uniref:hypothetical protein n=1 Tax=Elioraea sp. TaxID=2185103 RepID=UPI00307D259D